MDLDPSDKPLGRSFFNREAEDVARELIGCFLVRKLGRRVVKRITETEACMLAHTTWHAMPLEDAPCALSQCSVVPELFTFT